MARLFKTFAAIIVVLFSVPIPIGAVQSIKPKITITPAFYELVLDEGEKSDSFELEIKNDHDVAVSFKVTAIDFKGLDETGGLIFVGPAEGGLINKYGVAKWVKISPTEALLPAMQTSKFTVTVENLETLSPGGHYGALIVEAISASPSASNGAVVVIKQNLTSLLFVKKVGGERYDLSLKAVNHRRSLWSLPSKVDLKFYNPGNMYVMPRGIVEITDFRGKKVADGIINQETRVLLPEQERNYPATIKLLKKVSLPGIYKINVHYHYDGFEVFATKSTSLLYLPIVPLLALLALLLSISFAVRLIIKRLKNQKRRLFKLE